jgi:hypothetical protein
VTSFAASSGTISELVPVLEASEEADLSEEEGDLSEGENGEGGLDLHVGSPPFLEPEVLKRFRRMAVEVRRFAVVATPGGEVALRDPNCRPMAG